MQKDFNRREAINSVGAVLKNSLMQDIKLYKEMLTSCGKFKSNPRCNIKFEDKPVEILADELHKKRIWLNELQSGDIFERKKDILTRPFIKKEDVAYYIDEDSEEPYWHSQRGETPIRKTIKCYVLPTKEISSSYNGFIKLHPLFYWQDEMKEFIRTRDDTKLHHKFEWIRVGDKFFNKKDYFKYNGQAYSKSEYGLQEGKLIELSKVLKIESTSDYLFTYSSSGFKWSMNFFLESMPGEKFVNTQDVRTEDSFLNIICCTNDLSKWLLGGNFLNSMFISNKKRFYNNDNYLYMSLKKEDCFDLDLEPSEKHKQVFHQIESTYLTAHNRYISYQISEEEFRSRIMLGIGFRVEISNRHAKGILAQILREIFPHDRKFFLPELKKRLAILRELLAKEKEYAK